VKGNTTNTVIGFLLLTLMVLKVSSFHVYTHQDNITDTIENCNICDVALENQNTEYTFTSILVLLSTVVFIFYRKLSFVSLNETPSLFLRYKLFGRPPPK